MKPVELLVGTYTQTDSLGIYRLRFDSAEMSFVGLSVTSGIQNPSFIAVHPSGLYAYVVSEISTGLIYCYRVMKSGALRLLGIKGTGGSGPCHVGLNRSATVAIVSNYESGSVSSFQVYGDGTLEGPSSFVQHAGSSKDVVRQSSPHAHSVTYHPEKDIAFVADLGIDKIISYELKLPSCELIAEPRRFISTGNGFGPRHFCWHPSGQYLYCINELESSISTFRNSGDGVLSLIDTSSTLPQGSHSTNTSADIHISPDGKYVYGSNRGDDSIAVLEVDNVSGNLNFKTAISAGGHTPRNFALTPDGRFLFVANQDSNNIVVFERNPITGWIHQTGVETSIPSPVCIKFLPETKH